MKNSTQAIAHSAVPSLVSEQRVTNHNVSNTQQASSVTGITGNLVLLWGIGGVVALLSYAIVRLITISIAAFGFTLTPSHWAVLAVSVGFMAYAEGYRTFQKTWAPRVIGRAFELRENCSPIRLLFAPFYCMSFFHATRKRMLTAWITTILIILLVVLMNRMAQPWRGLIDAGVVVGLSWGVVALIVQTIKRLMTTGTGIR